MSIIGPDRLRAILYEPDMMSERTFENTPAPLLFFSTADLGNNIPLKVMEPERSIRTWVARGEYLHRR
jgi:hypothetical protein